jgi:hypothetical protein
MGTEYMHGLFVADHRWRSQPEHARRVHEVLERWGVAPERPMRLNPATQDSCARP